MKVSYTDWWNDVVAIVRANASILLAVVGAFVFLPTMLASFTGTAFVPPEAGASIDEAMAALTRFVSDNALSQGLLLLVTTLGQLLLYIVLLDERRPRVGEAFRLALPLFIPFIVLNILVSLLLGIGAVFLILPALYLLGRIFLAAPAMVAEGRMNPFAAIGRSFALTRGQGWRIAIFAILVFIVAFVIQLAVTGTLGLVFALLGNADNPYSVGKLLLAALQAVFTAALSILGIAVWVALYRRLTVDVAKTFS